jgi:hypothetical protein
VTRHDAVLGAIQEVCVSRSVMNYFKAYASRHLNRKRLDGLNRRRWARHGDTRWLQGVATSVFESHEPKSNGSGNAP